MKNDISEKTLGVLYQNLRNENIKKTPAFESLVPNLTGEKKGKTQQYAFYYALAASIALLMCIGSLLFYNTIRKNTGETEGIGNWTSLSDWEATTDSPLSISESQIELTFSASTDSLVEDSAISQKAD